jgi:hypothetical protein
MMMESLMMVSSNSLVVFLFSVIPCKDLSLEGKGIFCWKCIFLESFFQCACSAQIVKVVRGQFSVLQLTVRAGIHAAIGGPTGHLFEHNSQIIGQIRANLAACKVNIAYKQLSYTSQLLEQMKKKFLPTC